MSGWARLGQVRSSQPLQSNLSDGFMEKISLLKMSYALSISQRGISGGAKLKRSHHWELRLIFPLMKHPVVVPALKWNVLLYLDRPCERWELKKLSFLPRFVLWARDTHTHQEETSRRERTGFQIKEGRIWFLAIKTKRLLPWNGNFTTPHQQPIFQIQIQFPVSCAKSP